MVLRRLFGRLRGDSGGSAQEAMVFINLSDDWRKHKCSEAYVKNLSDRVMRGAVADLDRYFDATWARDVEPWLIMEGPALTYKFTVLLLPGWELLQMSQRINAVFNEHWDREIDRIPPY